MSSLTCAKCSEEVEELLELPCQHCICLMCLEEDADDLENFKCPMCQTECNLPDEGIQGLPRKYALTGVSREGPCSSPEVDNESSISCSGVDCNKTAVTYCADGCRYLCESCNSHHSMMPFTKIHTTKQIKDVITSQPPDNGGEDRDLKKTVLLIFHSLKQQLEQHEMEEDLTEGAAKCFRSMRENLRLGESRLLEKVEQTQHEIQQATEARAASEEAKSKMEVKVVKEVSDRPDGSSAQHLSEWKTSWPVGGVTGMALYSDNLLVVHWNDHHIYAYYPNGQKIEQYAIPGLGNPVGVTILPMQQAQDQSTQDHIAIADYKGRIWTVDVQVSHDGNWGFSNTKHINVSYQPDGVATDQAGMLLVADSRNCMIHIYDTQLRYQRCVSLPDGLKPWQITVDSVSGDYIIPDRHGKKIAWVNQDGQVTKNYEGDGYTIRPDQVACDADGNCIVTQCPNHTVELVSREGKHTQLLLRKKDQIRQPRRLCLDEKNHRLYVGHKGTDECTPQILVVEYPPSN